MNVVCETKLEDEVADELDDRKHDCQRVLVLDTESQHDTRNSHADGACNVIGGYG